MKLIKWMLATAATITMTVTMTTGTFAETNLTAETASPGGATHLSPAHLTEIAGTEGIANIQLSEGQTLTNSIQNVAEGKTDIAGTPHILPFLMMRGVGPYGSLGAEKVLNWQVIYGRLTRSRWVSSFFMPMTQKASAAGMI